MKFLLWLERHFAWVRWHPGVDEEGIEVIDQLHAQGQRVPAAAVKTKRTILLNIGTSVGGAVVIGVLSGVVSSQRLSQQITDTLGNHEKRIQHIEETYVPGAEKDQKVEKQIDDLNREILDAKRQGRSLQEEFDTFLIQRVAVRR